MHATTTSLNYIFMSKSDSVGMISLKARQCMYCSSRDSVYLAKGCTCNCNILTTDY